MSDNVDEAIQEGNDLLSQIEVEDHYSTLEAAQLFFDKTDQWIYWGLREGVFVDEKGKKISPVRVGKSNKKRYTLKIVQEIALASYRRGNISKPKLAAILKRIFVAKNGGSKDDILAVELPE